MNALRVAVIGLGGIAEKAYLPVLATRGDLDVVLITRNADTLHRIGTQYRLVERHTDLEQALTTGFEAAFVHTATASHVEIVARLLTAGIPVFVDKPLAYSYSDAALLGQQASASGVALMVGFNRRFAPAYREIGDWPARDVVVMQKHRTGPIEDTRRSIFDDFIHVVDTLRFLGPKTDEVAVTGKVVDGRLHHVCISVSDGTRSAFGLMSRVAGLTEETLEALAPGRKRRVVNLAETVDFIGSEQTHRRDEWRPVGVQRGFAQMCDAFLADVRAGRQPDIDDALATHAMCEKIVTRLEAAR